MMLKALTKYRRARGLDKHWTLAGTECSAFRMAVVIPALAERQSLPETLGALAENAGDCLDRTLVVVVVNQRENASVQIQQNNRETLLWLAASPFPRLNLAVVDAVSPGLELPPGDGVGLARKIGFDLSLERLDWAQEPVLISLDADTLVDDHYLVAVEDHFRQSRRGGAVIPFRHRSPREARLEEAVRHYELYLRSYLYGLTLAGSPYAYHTIGSAFCCQARAYVAAGGMVRRLAAEDFYFLQRLAKTSGVDLLRGTVVAPAARLSERVPIGTGPTLRRHVQENCLTYQFVGQPEFSVLKEWLAIIRRHGDLSGQELMFLAEECFGPLADFLRELDFISVWEKLRKNYASPEQRQAGFHVWFDALRTRQLLTRCAGRKERDPQTVIAELLEWGGQPAPRSSREQLMIFEGMQGVGAAEK